MEKVTRLTPITPYFMTNWKEEFDKEFKHEWDLLTWRQELYNFIEHQIELARQDMKAQCLAVIPEDELLFFSERSNIVKEEIRNAISLIK